jgi:hypothetical protein
MRGGGGQANGMGVSHLRLPPKSEIFPCLPHMAPHAPLHPPPQSLAEEPHGSFLLAVILDDQEEEDDGGGEQDGKGGGDGEGR